MACMTVAVDVLVVPQDAMHRRNGNNFLACLSIQDRTKRRRAARSDKYPGGNKRRRQKRILDHVDLEKYNLSYEEKEVFIHDAFQHRAVARDRGLVGKTCVITRRERSTRRYNAPSPSPRGGHRIRKKCSCS